MTYVKRRKGWRMSCDVGEVTERFESELCSFMSCDIGEMTEKLKNEQSMGGSPGELSEELVT